MQPKFPHSEMLKKVRELETFKSLVERSFSLGRMGCFNYDPVSNVMGGSLECFRILDVDVNVSLSEAFSGAAHPDDKDLILYLTERVQINQTPFCVEYRVLNKKGELLYVQAKGEFIETPDGKIMVGIVKDITEHKKIEDQLIFQSDILETVEQAVIVTDLNGEIFYLNKFAEWLYGWKSVEVIGRNVLEIIVPRISKEQAVQIMDTLSKGSSWSGEFLVQHRDGRVFPASVTDIPFFEEGKFSKIVGVSVDITEKKAKEEELLKKQNELKNHAKELEELNTALKVLMDYNKKEIDDFRKSVVSKFKKIVLPYFPMSVEQKTHEELSAALSLIENNIKEILFGNKAEEEGDSCLSPTESHVAFMIKSGKSSKEIADSLSMSLRTVYFHRENLRKKLKLSREKNLNAHLQSFKA